MARRVASGSVWSISAMMAVMRCSSVEASTMVAKVSGFGTCGSLGFGGLGAGAGLGWGAGSGVGSVTGLTGEGFRTEEAFDRRMQSQAQLMISEASAPRLVSCG